MAMNPKDLLVWIKSLARGQALPLDASEVHESLKAAQDYAGTAIAYGGQTVKVKLDDGKYHEYILQPSGDGYQLEEIRGGGSAGIHVGDESSMPEGTVLHIDPDGEGYEMIELDTTLSKAGYAADANVTGKRIDALHERLDNVEQNGSGSGGGIANETDPTVPDWAKQPEKPTYTAAEVGAATEERVNQLFEQLSRAIVNHAVWYGESPTDRTQATKIVNTTTGDFKLQKGARILVKFLANTGMGNSLNVDGTGAVYVHAIHNDDEELEPEVIPTMWNNIGQIQAFTYDGMYFIADDCIRATADNGLFGKVGVSNSVTSDSGDSVASSKAVKTAYDKAVEAINAVAALDTALAAAIGSGVVS